MGLAGVNAQQSTVFDTLGDLYRPLSQSTVRKAIFIGKQITGTYDWATHVGALDGRREEEPPGAGAAAATAT